MGLELSDLNPNPIAQFAVWFEEARSSSGMSYPNATCLSTIGDDGFPDGRIVLLRGFDEEGFVFYTNLESEKGTSLLKCPKAAMNFYWDELQRQVRVQGSVSQVSNEEADAYFSSRPRNSQLGAWASRQSRVLQSREELERRLAQFEEKFSGGLVPRPPHWSGFRLSPKKIEFWQEREFRLHDRFVFRKQAAGWQAERLSP